jgi:pimeloyl-ACP methyl ester carboxylesterase
VSLLRASLRIDAGVELPGEGALQVAVEIVSPSEPVPVALVCLPGGGMSKRYFDLQPPAKAGGGDLQAPGDDSFSFAAQMARRGFISVLVDPLGVGQSSRPKDSYALTAERLAQANANALQAVTEQIRKGSLFKELQPIPKVVSMGIGHSMGALLTIVQQAAHRQHAGIAVLGFSTRGLPEYLMGEARELAADPAAARREVVRLARATFGEDYPWIGRTAEGSALYAGKSAQAAGVEAIKAARERLLPVTAFQSMLPGNVAPEAARIDVPVFVGLGERDMAGPPLEAPKAFTASPAVTFKLLPGAGHSHFLFASRVELFDALAQWAATVAARAAPTKG